YNAVTNPSLFPVNLEGNILLLNFYIANQTTLDKLNQIIVRIKTNPSSFNTYEVSAPSLNIGWNTLSIDLAYPNSTFNGGADLTNVDEIRFITNTDSNSDLIALGDIKMDCWGLENAPPAGPTMNLEVTQTFPPGTRIFHPGAQTTIATYIKNNGEVLNPPTPIHKRLIFNHTTNPAGNYAYSDSQTIGINWENNQIIAISSNPFIGAPEDYLIEGLYDITVQIYEDAAMTLLIDEFFEPSYIEFIPGLADGENCTNATECAGGYCNYGICSSYNIELNNIRYFIEGNEALFFPADLRSHESIRSNLVHINRGDDFPTGSTLYYTLEYVHTSIPNFTYTREVNYTWSIPWNTNASLINGLFHFADDDPENHLLNGTYDINTTIYQDAAHTIPVVNEYHPNKVHFSSAREDGELCTNASDCAGGYCNDGTCASDPCTGVNCSDYCDNTTLYNNGFCTLGTCNYAITENATECGFVPPPINVPPTHTTPILNSTLGTNLSSENLTCYPQNVNDADGDPVTTIFNWYVDDDPITILNMPFDTDSETVAKDYSGNNNDGTVEGAIFTSGKVGGAYYFNSDDLINTSIYPDNSFRTLMAWAKFDEIGKDIMIAGTHDTNNHRFYIGINQDNSLFYGLGNKFNISVAYPNISADEWHLFALTGDGSTARMYFDGIEMNSFDYVFTGTSSVNFVIGARNDLNTIHYSNVTVDEVMILDRTLTENQIKEYYNLHYNKIHSDETAPDEEWKCAVTPNDGIDDGITLFSNQLMIGLPVCFTNSDCGTDGPLGPPVCDGDNVVNDYITFTCENPGTTQAQCTNFTIGTSEICVLGCENGSCLTTAPCTDSDGGLNYTEPGVTAYEGIPSASLDSCKDTYTLYEGYCDANGTKQVQEHTCEFQCSEGACIEDPCAEIVCDDYCDNTTLYQGTCRSGNCLHRIVSNSSQCGFPECFTHQDCGVSYTIEGPYCDDVGIVVTHTQPLCENPGLPNATCKWWNISQRTRCYNGCVNATCVDYTQCIDGDGGKNYYERGVLSIAGTYAASLDKCKDSNILYEQYCENNTKYIEEYYCENGCDEGVCLESIDLVITDFVPDTLQTVYPGEDQFMYAYVLNNEGNLSNASQFANASVYETVTLTHTSFSRAVFEFQIAHFSPEIWVNETTKLFAWNLFAFDEPEDVLIEGVYDMTYEIFDDYERTKFIDSWSINNYLEHIKLSDGENCIKDSECSGICDNNTCITQLPDFYFINGYALDIYDQVLPEVNVSINCDGSEVNSGFTYLGNYALSVGAEYNVCSLTASKYGFENFVSPDFAPQHTTINATMLQNSSIAGSVSGEIYDIYSAGILNNVSIILWGYDIDDPGSPFFPVRTKFSEDGYFNFTGVPSSPLTRTMYYVNITQCHNPTAPLVARPGEDEFYRHNVNCQVFSPFRLIDGYVFNKSGSPIVNASAVMNVVGGGTLDIEKTDIFGYYSMLLINVSQYYLVFSSEGYYSNTTQNYNYSVGNKTINVTLETAIPVDHNVTTEGFVFDNMSNPITGTLVIISINTSGTPGSLESTLSNELGYYRMSPEIYFPYSITAAKAGYMLYESPYFDPEDGDLFLNITLE
ncbi:LamG-like jellyroll fold domain-containing protein, partial [Thermoproteota archaeon]